MTSTVTDDTIKHLAVQEVALEI